MRRFYEFPCGGTTAQAAFNTQWARAANTTFWNNTVLDPGVVNQYQSATVYQRGGMTLQAATDKAFKRVEEIFAKYPIAQT